MDRTDTYRRIERVCASLALCVACLCDVYRRSYEGTSVFRHLLPLGPVANGCFSRIGGQADVRSLSQGPRWNDLVSAHLVRTTAQNFLALAALSGNRDRYFSALKRGLHCLPGVRSLSEYQRWIELDEAHPVPPFAQFFLALGSLLATRTAPKAVRVGDLRASQRC